MCCFSAGPADVPWPRTVSISWSGLPANSSFPYRMGLQLLDIASDQLEGVKQGEMMLPAEAVISLDQSASVRTERCVSVNITYY